MRLRPQARTVAPKYTVRLLGNLEAQDANATTVAIYKGSSATPFALAPVHVMADGTGCSASR